MSYVRVVRRLWKSVRFAGAAESGVTTTHSFFQYPRDVAAHSLSGTVADASG